MTKTNETLTKAICNKGFSGNSSILPRSNFGVFGQGSTPQSLTAYSRKPLPTRRRKDSDTVNDRNNGLRMKKEMTMNEKRFSFISIKKKQKNKLRLLNIMNY